MSSSYTFFKLLNLSRSNGQKKILINANILISISLVIPYLLHSIPTSKPKKTQKIIRLSLIFFFPPFLKKKKKNPRLDASLSLCLFLLHCSSTSTAKSLAEKKKKKKKEEEAAGCTTG